MEEQDIVVALAKPANIPKLMRLGGMMALQFGGKVVAVTVVVVEQPMPEDGPRPHRLQRAEERLRRAQEVAASMGVSFDARLALVRTVEDVLDELAEARHARAIVVGYSERPHPLKDRDYDTLTDELAAHAPCSLVVARFNQGGEHYRRVLVPVAEPVSMDTRRDLLTALHHQAGAEVDLVHFADSAQAAERMRGQLREWLVERGVSEWINARVEVNPDAGPAIVEAARGYDAVVLGTPPLHPLRRRLLGSVSEYVAENVTCAALIIRQYEGLVE